MCRSINYAGCKTVDVQGRSGGLALFWKNEGGVDIKGVGRHYIDFEVIHDQIGRWRYTGFYGCPERGRRRESWDHFKRVSRLFNAPMVHHWGLQ